MHDAREERGKKNLRNVFLPKIVVAETPTLLAVTLKDSTRLLSCLNGLRGSWRCGFYHCKVKRGSGGDYKLTGEGGGGGAH